VGQPPRRVAFPTSYGSRDTERLAEVPSRLATRIAVDFVSTVPADNSKGALLLAPSGMLIYDGIVTFAEFVPSPRAILAASGAPEVRVTVQVVLPSERSDVAAQDTFEILVAGRIVSVPPLAVAASVLAAAVTAVSPVKPSVDDPGALKDTAKLTAARTPFGISASLAPQMMQRTCPVPLVHDNDFPTAVSAAPAVSFTLLKTLAEYVRVHSRALGSELEEAESIVMLAEPEPPATAVPGTTWMPVCANATGTIRTNQYRHELIRQYSSSFKMWVSLKWSRTRER
jgi:hypothetical protein